MRPRGVLRMVLYGKGRVFLMLHALQATVVEVHMGQLDLLGIKAVQVDAEAVILRGYLDMAGLQILDRLIGTPMAELQLIGGAAVCQAENLMAETYPENRHFTEKIFYCFHSIGYRGWITRTVAQKYTIRLLADNFIKRHSSGYDLYITAMTAK